MLIRLYMIGDDAGQARGLSEETDVEFGLAGHFKDFSHFNHLRGCLLQILREEKVET
jgi:hypothetical protein